MLKFNPITGKFDYSASGFTGTLLDSTETPIAEVLNGLIVNTYFLDGKWDSTLDNWDSLTTNWNKN